MTRPGPARRALDVLLSATALILLLPVLLAVALAVKLTSRGPVLFRQERVGEGGAPFVLVKFRSMAVGRSGPEVTAAHDPRVTRLGRWLRATSVDELPQFWHVLRGHMTLVGPRPETPALAARYPEPVRWVLDHRPGLTGPAQLGLRDDVALDTQATDPEVDYLERLVPQRVALDALYLRNPSLIRTVDLLASTVRAVVTGRPQPVLPPVDVDRQGLSA